MLHFAQSDAQGSHSVPACCSFSAVLPQLSCAQVFYLLVVIGGYLTFAIYGYAYLPNRFLAGWHKYTGFALFNICVWVWWKAIA